jgi:hypothetical protein
MNKSETIGKIAAALAKAQGEMGTAIKDAKNPFFKSKYADLNSIREACMPSLQKHGISLLQPTIERNGHNYVETLLLHESGEWLSCETEILFGKKDDAQAQGSGITYARRYGMQSMLNVGADDDDGNTASQPAKEQPKATEPPKAKPFLERGTQDFTNVTNALLQGKATIEDVKKKFQLIEPMENELANLKVKK